MNRKQKLRCTEAAPPSSFLPVIKKYLAFIEFIL